MLQPICQLLLEMCLQTGENWEQQMEVEDPLYPHSTKHFLTEMTEISVPKLRWARPILLKTLEAQPTSALAHIG